MGSYLLAAGDSELERLRLQSRVWEPAGRELLRELEAPEGATAVEIGCGPMGWLPLLSEWAGDGGRVVGTDLERRMLDVARSLVAANGLANVELAQDDLFDSHLPRGSFDLVHARFQIAPLGQAEDQIDSYLGLCGSGAWLILEDADPASWHYNPPAPAAEELIGWIHRAFAARGGDLAAGRRLPRLLVAVGLQPLIRAHVVALPARHPYLLCPLFFAESLFEVLSDLMGNAHLGALKAEATRELGDDQRWGTTFTLVQAWARSSA